MRKMRKIVFVVLSFLAFSRCASEDPVPVEFEGEAVNVSVSVPTVSNAPVQVSATGKLISKKSVNVSTRMMGFVTSLPVSVGQSVRSGQHLVSIYSADIQAKDNQVEAQIRQARTNFELAKKDYERFQNLYHTQSASEKELENIAARYEMARAGLEAAEEMKREVEAQYDYTEITAPISGVVTAKFVEEGDLANPGMPLLMIESPSVLQAQIMVSERYITQISKGMEVDLLLPSINQEVEGKVSEISYSSTHTGGQYVVKIDLPSHSDLLPGMYVSGRFLLPENISLEEERESTVWIPKAALIKKGQLTGIYMVSSQNTTVLRWLRTGRELEENIEVLSGLRPDETFIVSADSRLYNGTKVNVK